LIFLGGLFIGVNFSGSQIFSFNFTLVDDAGQSLTTADTNPESQQGLEPLKEQGETKPDASRDKMVDFALHLINADREKNGLLPVKLGHNQAAQNHVDDMLRLNYFSHWNSEGTKPYVAYTQFGGQGYLQENIAVSWCEGLLCRLDPLEQIQKAQYSMVYDDADSNWGHRDAILNPSHTHVNIGLAYDNNSFYYAQHFETRVISWQALEVYSGTLDIKGSLPHDGYSINSILIYRDDDMKSLTGVDLGNLEPYNQRFYDQGALVGALVEKPSLLMFYEECEDGKIELKSKDDSYCISYATYDKISGSNFEIKADISKWINQPGLYTMYVNLEDPAGRIISATSLTLDFIR
jgi:uncharacterized protein YkwD